MDTDTVFNYSDNIMRHLYALHQLEGKDSFGNYEGFCNSLIDYVDDIGVTIFHLLPQISLPDDESFFDALDDKELEQLSGFANLLGIAQKDCPFEIIPNATPDICLDIEEGSLQISTFQNNYPAVFALGDEATGLIWDNFTVEDMQGFSEEQQRVFLRMVDFNDYNFSHEDNIKSHKRLVFGLHIPQDLKYYHDECILELGVRMLSEPVTIDFLDVVESKVEAENKDVLLLEHEKDKRTVVAFFMQQLSDIWLVPTPIEEDYSKAPREDKEGKEFSCFMHAFYRAAANDNEPAGLIYGINTHKGYLSGEQSTLYTLETLAHEFSHLVANFVVINGAHKPWTESGDTARLLQENSLLKIPELREQMRWNSPVYRGDFYYSATKTDFSGLSKLNGKHSYKGQLEERHADYVGEGVRNMIEFCLNTREYIFDLSKAKLEFKSMATSILKHLGEQGCQDEAIELIEQLFVQAETDEKLYEAYSLSIEYAQNWIDENVDLEKEYRRKKELRKNGDNITTRHLFAIKHLEDFEKFGHTFFELRERIVDIDCAPEQTSKNSLSL